MSELLNSDLFRRIWSSVRGIHDIHGVSEESIHNMGPRNVGRTGFSMLVRKAFQDSLTSSVPCARNDQLPQGALCWGSRRTGYGPNAILLLWTNSPR